MRNFLFVALLTFNGFSFAAAETAEDIVIKTRLDHEGSSSLIGRIRTALINNNVGDPYNQTFPTPVVVDFNQVLDDLPADTQSWIKELQNILSLKLFESSYKLRVEQFSYQMTNFTTEVKPVSADLNRIEYVTVNEVQGLKISAEKIAFQVELQRTQSGAPIKFEIELVQPTFIVSPDAVLELPMGWHTFLLPDAVHVSLHTIDLSKVFAKLIQSPSLVSLQVKDLLMPNVSIRVGSKEVTIDREKLKKLMINRQNEMKMAIIDLLSTRMEKFGNIIQDNPQEVFLPRNVSVAAVITPVFKVKALNANPDTKILEVKVDGHYCAKKEDVQNNYCEASQLTAKLRRQIENASFVQSMEGITTLFSQRKANVAVSISEHYLNQVISAAASAGLIDLAGDDFALGPEKAFILAEEKGEGFNLYLDIIYKLTQSERVFTGRTDLRFPVKLGIGIKIIEVDGYPRFQIKVLENKTNESILLKGLPKYSLFTTVHKARFKKKVVGRISERLKPFDQKILMDIELKEFKGTYLEQLNFFSDGKGRATAIMFLDSKK